MSQKSKWPVEGKEHSEVNIDSIYKNGLIRGFVNKEENFIIIASKGMGKTLLLRTKKENFERNNPEYLIIPRSDEFDEPRFTGTISSKKITSNIESWRSLWEVSIIFSILSHSNAHRNDYDFMDSIEDLFLSLSKLNDKIKNDFKKIILKKESLKPSYFLNEILTRCSYTDIEQFIKETSKVYVYSTKFITNTVCVFIDAFDQTLADSFTDNIELWKNGQLGLLKAVHKIHLHNKHIKVYSSIRQEAFSGFKDAERSVISGKSTLLEYTKADLLKLFIHAIKEYTAHDSIKGFIGFDTIFNKFIQKEELVFDYIYRHSIYTPRSIIKFGKAIDDMDEVDVEEFKSLINKIASKNLLRDYLISEKLLFLNYFKKIEDIDTFLNLLPTNVLHYKSLTAIKNIFANKMGYSPNDCHPFCELFNIGLLGQIVQNTTSPELKKQEFVKPHEFNWQQNHIIHSNNEGIFLIHPSLFESIIAQRGLDNYRINTKNAVGDESIWIDSKTFPIIFISHSSLDKPILEKYFLEDFENKMNERFPINLWYDKNSITIGEELNNAVEKGVKSSDIVIVIISQQSLDSQWVDKEWRTKHNEEINENKIKVICLIIDDSPVSSLPPFLQNKNTLILKNYTWQTAIKKLSDDIYFHLKTNKVI